MARMAELGLDALIAVLALLIAPVVAIEMPRRSRFGWLSHRGTGGSDE